MNKWQKNCNFILTSIIFIFATSNPGNTVSTPIENQKSNFRKNSNEYSQKLGKIPSLEQLAANCVLDNFTSYPHEQQKLLTEETTQLLIDMASKKYILSPLFFELKHGPHIIITAQTKKPSEIHQHFKQFSKVITIDGYDDIWSQKTNEPYTLQSHINDNECVNYGSSGSPRTFRPERLLETCSNSTITTFAASTNESSFAIGRDDGTVTLFTLHSSEENKNQEKEYSAASSEIKEQTIPLHKGSILALGYNQKNTLLISYDNLNTAAIWNIVDKIPVITFNNANLIKIKNYVEKKSHIVCTQKPILLQHNNELPLNFLENPSVNEKIFLINLMALKNKILTQSNGLIDALNDDIALFYKNLKQSELPEIAQHAIKKEIKCIEQKLIGSYECKIKKKFLKKSVM